MKREQEAIELNEYRSDLGRRFDDFIMLCALPRFYPDYFTEEPDMRFCCEMVGWHLPWEFDPALLMWTETGDRK